MKPIRRPAVSILRSLVVFALVGAVIVAVTSTIAHADAPARPTVVLVHGAFAESSSWDKVAQMLLRKRYPVVAVANPLRGLKSDAAYVADALDAIAGPVILVGHSYGGSVISNAAMGKPNVKALIYVAGFAPEEGESAGALTAKFPGSTLGSALAPAVPLADGNKDLYIVQSRFRDQFAADVPERDARLMAATQRPITAAAIDEPAGKPAWTTIPAWFLYGSLDRNIPPAAQAFMAHRAASRKTVVVRGASHVVMVSHPAALAALVDEAADAMVMP